MARPCWSGKKTYTQRLARAVTVVISEAQMQSVAQLSALRLQPLEPLSSQGSGTICGVTSYGLGKHRQRQSLLTRRPIATGGSKQGPCREGVMTDQHEEKRSGSGTRTGRDAFLQDGGSRDFRKERGKGEGEKRRVAISLRRSASHCYCTYSSHLEGST